MKKKRKWRNGGRECADSTTHPVTTFSYLPTQMPPSTFSWRCNSKIFFKKMLWRRSNDVLSMLLVDDVCYIDDTFHVCGRWFYGGPPPPGQLMPAVATWRKYNTVCTKVISYTSRAVWPDLAKFHHFGKTLIVFGYSLKIYFLLGKVLNPIVQNLTK